MSDQVYEMYTEWLRLKDQESSEATMKEFAHWFFTDCLPRFIEPPEDA